MRFSAGPNDFQGEVYIWTDHGLAAVVGCVWTGKLEHQRRRIFHEFHSTVVAATRLRFRGRDKGGTPRKPGSSSNPYRIASPPAENEAVGSRKCGIGGVHFSADMTKQGVKSDLRLLPPAPLSLRNPTSKDAEVIDGAVFAYVWTGGALDPEVFLVIEGPSGGQWSLVAVRTGADSRIARLRSKHQGKPGVASRSRFARHLRRGDQQALTAVVKALFSVKHDRRRPRGVMTTAAAWRCLTVCSIIGIRT